MQNNLIVFDIDGTLTNTFQTDTIFFEKAITDAVPSIKLIRDWHSYTYSTDSGFLLEIFHENLARKPFAQEIQAIKNVFLSYLDQAFRDDSTSCLPIPGAHHVFAKIQVAAPDWDVAIATGCWEKSALLKLDIAKIPFLSIPLAHADDSIKREEIIQIAMQRAKTRYNRKNYGKIVYVGDRLWDKAAADKLEIDFIGVGPVFAAIKNQQFLQIQDYVSDELLNYLKE